MDSAAAGWYACFVRRILRRLGSAASVGTVVVLLAPGSAAAGSKLTVCPGGPPACDYTTIQAALAVAADGDLIAIHPGTYGGGVQVDKRVVLSGAGRSTTTIAGGPEGAVVTIEPDVQAKIKNLTITGGLGGREANGIMNDGTLTLVNSAVSRNGDGFADTGGILNNGTLTLDDCTVSENEGSFTGGILNFGSLTLTQSTVADNRSSHSGGGIHNLGTLTARHSTISGNYGVTGGGLANDGTATIRYSTISANAADEGGGIANVGTLVVRHSAIDDNESVFGSGGGLSNGGTAGIATIVDTTINGNTSVRQGGGIHNEHGGAVTLRFSTVTGNTAQDAGGTGIFGGGIYNNLATVILDRSSVTGNTPDDCVGC
jgi:hypothetical protein